MIRIALKLERKRSFCQDIPSCFLKSKSVEGVRRQINLKEIIDKKEKDPNLKFGIYNKK